jgi:hypothetical protein
MKNKNPETSFNFIMEETSFVKNNELNIIKEDKYENGITGRISAKTRLQDTQLNQNRRIYPSVVCEEIVRQMRVRVDAKQALMEINHPFMTSDPTEFKSRATKIDLNNCGAALRNIYFEDGVVFGEFDTLFSFKGPDLTNLIIRDKIDPGFSLRMLGNTQQHPTMENVMLVQPTLTAITYDVVTNQSHKNATIVSFLTEDYSKFIGSVDLRNMELLTESTHNEQLLMEGLQLPRSSAEILEEHMRKFITESVMNFKKNIIFNF